MFDLMGNEIKEENCKNLIDDKDWGLVFEKPIFVVLHGDIDYLSHLRDLNGKVIKWNRLGSSPSNSKVGGPTDIWDGKGQDGKEYRIYINWYGLSTPSRAPEGLMYKEDVAPTTKKLLTMGCKVVYSYTLKPEGFEVLQAFNTPGPFPNFICKYKGKACVIKVVVFEYSNVFTLPVVVPEEKKKIFAIGKKMNATPYIAIVKFKFDEDDFSNPEFRYGGLIEVTGDEPTDFFTNKFTIPVKKNQS